MKLSTRISLWMGFMLLIMALSSFLAMDALYELKKTNHAISENYEVTFSASRIRERLIRHHDSGLAAAITRDSLDIARWREQNQLLRDELEIPLNPMIDRHLRRDFDRLRGQVRHMLQRAPSLGDGEYSSPQTLLKSSYRELYAGALEGFDRLIERSRDLVIAETDEDLSFFARNLPLNFLVLLLALVTLIWGIVYYRRRVLRPFQTMTALIRQIHLGNLAVRWKESRSDELGEMGTTVNAVVDELVKRRKERVEFIGSVAHDLKNPIAAIQLKCQLAMRMSDRSSVPSLLKVLESIQQQTARLDRLTNDLLEAAKDSRPIWRLNSTWFPLSTLLRQVVEEARTVSPEHIYVLMMDEGEGVQIHADRERITQVLTNLLSNAAKYSPQGSTIEVQLGHAPDQSSPKNELWIEVRDRGIGIPDAQKTRIFEPFSRLDQGRSMSQGTGLGLAIVKDILLSHGGSIQALDRPDGGTLFRVTLPAGSVQSGLRRELGPSNLELPVDSDRSKGL